MPPIRFGNVLSWAVDLDDKTKAQVETLSRLWTLAGPVALMSDAHLGKGATIGSVIATTDVIIPSAVGVDIGCVDADTEYLSPNGWRRIADYDGGMIMQYHPANGSAAFVQPYKYIVRKQEKFLHFRTKYGVDQMLTPDHRVLCWKPFGRARDYRMEVTTAEAYAERHASLVQGNKAAFETTFCPLLATRLFLTDTQLRVQVMLMADGWFDYNKAVLRLKKLRKIERATKLLEDSGIPYVVRSYPDGTTSFRFTPPVKAKTYSWCWPASLDQLRVITEECLEWDGDAKDRVFFTSEKDSADFMHYAFSACGWRSVLRVDQREHLPEYRVFAHTNTRIAMGGVPKTDITEVESKDGKAYCFSVASRFLVLRRNGNVFMTGNCGVAGIETDLKASDLPDDLTPLRDRIASVIPAGLGKWHREPTEYATRFMQELETRRVLENGLTSKGAIQLGTLGSGNHFFEVCLDEREVVWLLLHSGSRGIGNVLATIHIKKAQELAKDLHIPLEDVDLAYFTAKMSEFADYMEDLLFAQEYALENRNLMLDAALTELFASVGEWPNFKEVQRINNHHNYTAREHHFGRDMWITRKGAIRARQGDKGVIPGSMGDKSYIVVGKGNPSSYMSCAHGAGRRMSRTQARKTLSTQTLLRQMAGKVWLDRNAQELLDEAPDAYKAIDAVMAAQSDLVQPVHELRQILNYKGVA